MLWVAHKLVYQVEAYLLHTKNQLTTAKKGLRNRKQQKGEISKGTSEALKKEQDRPKPSTTEPQKRGAV